MSFWNLSTGSAAKTDGNANMGGDDIEPIPDGTKVRAMITEATWKDANEYGPRHINVRWDVVDGEYLKRVVWQKIKIGEEDKTKRDKAIMMLAAIDSNCGGKLMASGDEPTDMDLMKNLTNTPMLIRVGLWEFNDRKGNWVQAVEGKNNATPPPEQGNEINNPVTEQANNDIGF